jgi:hypothetical protein
MKKLVALALLAASAAHADPVEYRFWMAADCDAAPALCSPVDIPGKFVVDALPDPGAQTFEGPALLSLDFFLNDAGIGGLNLSTTDQPGARVTFLDGTLSDIHFSQRVTGLPGTAGERFFDVVGLRASWAGQNTWNIVRVQQVQAVPEPESYALLLAGLAFTASSRCRRWLRGRLASQ